MKPLGNRKDNEHQHDGSAASAPNQIIAEVVLDELVAVLPVDCIYKVRCAVGYIAQGGMYQIIVAAEDPVVFGQERIIGIIQEDRSRRLLISRCG